MAIDSILPAKLNPHPLVTCKPQQSIHEVARLMKRHNVGSVVITENDSPQGIVTDRDILIRAIAREPAISLADPVRLIMSAPLKTITLYEGLHDAMRIMKEAQIRRLPVINSLGVVVGILTFSDLYALLSHEMNDLNDIVAAESGFEFSKLVA